MGMLKGERRMRILLKGSIGQLKGSGLCLLLRFRRFLEAVQEHKRDPGSMHENE